MGFQIPKQRLEKITFSGDPLWEGAEFMVNIDMTIGQVETIEIVRKKIAEADEPDYGLHMEMLDAFYENVLVSWNLEDDNGVPIPINMDAVKNLPQDLVLDIMRKYAEYITGQVGVNENLDQRSNGLSGSPEELTHLVGLSQSPSS